MVIKPAKTSHVSQAFKNIIIGTITTVAASVIVWWLGFSDNKTDEKKKHKEATYKAWETLDRYERIYVESMEDFNCRMILNSRNSFEPEDAEAIIRQMTNNINTLTDVKNEPDIDIDIKALLQRRITYYGAIKSETQKLSDVLAAVGPDPVQSETQSKLIKKYITTMSEISLAEQKPSTALMISIEKKFGEELKGTKVRLDLDTKNIVGYWRIDSANVFDIQPGGKLVSKIDNTTLNGSWKMDSDNVVLEFGDGDKGTIKVTSLTKKIMSYIVLDDNSYHAACRN